MCFCDVALIFLTKNKRVTISVRPKSGMVLSYFMHVIVKSSHEKSIDNFPLGIE